MYQIFILFFLFFLLDRSSCIHSMLIVGWRSYNPRTEATVTLKYVPLMYLTHYVISHVFGSCPLLATANPLPLHSPLPRPMPLLPPPLHLIGPVLPIPIIS